MEKKRPQFPAYAALIIPGSPQAHSLRLLGPVKISKILTIKASDEIQLHYPVSFRTTFPVHDAGLLLAPYVKLGAMSEELSEGLKQAKLVVSVDWEVISEKCPLPQFYRDSDGNISDEPWCNFHNVHKVLLWGIATKERYGEVVADPKDAIGIFLPDDVTIAASVKDVPEALLDEDVNIEIGLIVGHYTAQP